MERETRAFIGITVPEFPEFVICTGPWGPNGGEDVSLLQRQSE